jgi:hypothetical protein
MKKLVCCFVLLFVGCGFKPTEPEAKRVVRRTEERLTMATVHTYVSTSGDFGSTSSWKTGVVPSLFSDIALFDGSSNVPCLVGVDRGTADFQLKVTPNHIGQIGSPSAPLTWDGVPAAPLVAATLRGPGRVHLKFNSNSVRVVLDNPLARRSDVTIDGAMGFLVSKNGRGSIVSTCAFSTVGAIYILGRHSDILVAAPEGSEAGWKFLRMNEGNFESDRTPQASSTIELAGGVMRQTKIWSGTSSIRMYDGVLEYVPNPPSVVNNIYSLLGGIFDIQGNVLNLFDGFTGGIEIGPNMVIDGAVSLETAAPGSIDLRNDYPGS